MKENMEDMLTARAERYGLKNLISDFFPIKLNFWF